MTDPLKFLQSVNAGAAKRRTNRLKIINSLMEENAPTVAGSTTPSTPITSTGKKYAGPATSGGKELYSTLQKAGFKGEALRRAWAVAMAESGGRSNAHNPNAKTGDNSYGLFQINMLGNLGPARLKQYDLSSNEDLFDPLKNAQVAYKMSGGGKNWKPWSAFKNGASQKYYDQFVGLFGG